MALSEFEVARFEKPVRAYVEQRRPSPPIRKELDYGFRWTGQSIEIFEMRPHWRKPEITLESPIAKATYVKSKRMWKIYWMRADLRWHRYEPHPSSDSIEEFLEVVDKDTWGCFYG